MIKKSFKYIIGFIIFPVIAFAQNIVIDGKIVIDDVLDERILIPALEIPNYREELRQIIISIKKYVNENNPDFIVAVKGGQELFYKSEWEKKLKELQVAETNNDRTDEEVFLSSMFNPQPPSDPVGTEQKIYLNHIDAWFANNLICDNKKIDPDLKNTLQKYKVPLFSAENCSIRAKNADYIYGYIESQEISDADPINNSPNNIFDLKQAKNIFFLKDNKFYQSKDAEIAAIRNNNYDVLVINPFFKDKIVFNKKEIDKMKTKKIGGKRLVLAYFNLAIVNDKMYFWKQDWTISNPYWIRLNSPFYSDQYVVEYWDDNWQKIIDEYLKGVIALGFDGIFIDGLDYHYLFEKLTPA